MYISKSVYQGFVQVFMDIRIWDLPYFGSRLYNYSVGVAKQHELGFLVLRVYNWEVDYCPLYGVARCPLFRGFKCTKLYGEKIGAFRTARYISVGVRTLGVYVKRGSTVTLYALH